MNTTAIPAKAQEAPHQAPIRPDVPASGVFALGRLLTEPLGLT